MLLQRTVLGGLLAERLREDGCEVTVVTPAAEVSTFCSYSLEQRRIQTKLLNLGVEIRPHRQLTGLAARDVELSCVFTGRAERLACDAVVLVTSREPRDDLYRSLCRVEPPGIRTLRRVGDCLVPSTIAQAVWDGHRAARELEGPSGNAAPLKLEYVQLEQR